MNSSATKELQVGKQINLNLVTGIGNVLASSSKDAGSANADVNIDKNMVSCTLLTSRVPCMD